MRTYVRMGQAGHPPYIDLEAALERGDLPNAWLAAHERSFIPLDQALRLTILIGLNGKSPRFENVARRFLVRFIRECKPTLDQVKRVADALNEVQEDYIDRPAALKALDSLAEQIKRQALERQKPPTARSGA